MMSEEVAVAAGHGAMFAGGNREVIVTGDYLNWYSWSCPLEKVAGLYADDGLLAVIGDGQLAVSEIRHKGTLWQVVELAGEPTCIHIAIGNRIFVGTQEGRLFVFTVQRKRGVLEWLGLTKTAPIIEESVEMAHSEPFSRVPDIEWGIDGQAEETAQTDRA